MSETTLHPKSAASALLTALDLIMDRNPESISTAMVADEAVRRNPDLEVHKPQLERQASDLIRAQFDFGLLQDEAEAIGSRDPATMTREERMTAITRLQEIGAALNAAANTLDYYAAQEQDHDR